MALGSGKLLRQAMDTTAKLTSFVVFILVGSSVFTLTFRGVDGDLWVDSLLTGLPDNQTAGCGKVSQAILHR